MSAARSHQCSKRREDYEPTGQYSFIPNSFHPKHFTTCQIMEVGEDGTDKETQQFEHFQTSPDRKPSKIAPKYEQTGWTNFNTQTNEEMYTYAVRAIRCNNFEVDEASGMNRMFFLPKVFEQVKKEGYRQEDGSWGWAPKNITARDFVGTYNLKGEQVDKQGNLLPDPESAAAAAPSAKKSPSKPKKEQKPKIERVKEKGSHDVAAMLVKKKEAPVKTPPPPPAVPTATTPAATMNRTHKALSLIPSNLFSDDDEPAAAAAASSASSPFLYNNDNVADFFSQLMGNYIDLCIKKNEVEVLKERFKEVAETMDEAAKMDNPMDKRKFVTEKYKEQNGVALAMHLFPFLNADAAKIVREKLKM